MIILHAAETIKGGVATVMNKLIKYQVAQEEVKDLICLIPSDQNENLLNSSKITTCQFKRNGRSILGMLAFFFSIFRLIIKRKPDVIHLHSSFSGLLGRVAILLTGRRKKTKIIYCPHAFGFLMKTSKFKKNIYIYIEKFLSKFTNTIICVSNNEYENAIKYGFKKDKLIVIHNGVETKSKSNTYIKNNKKHYKLLFVGRFDYQKGIDILLKSLKILSKKNIQNTYELTLIGESVNNEFKFEFENIKNITINKLGWLKQEQLETYYLNHDALIIPSRWEGFAMVPLEAMSYGLPIIAKHIDAFKELETDEEKHITFFNDEIELSAILFNINNIDLEKNCKLSKKIFLEKFNDTKMTVNTFLQYK